MNGCENLKKDLFFNEICGCATRHEGESRTRADAGCIVNYTLLGFVLPRPTLAHFSYTSDLPMLLEHFRTKLIEFVAVPISCVFSGYVNFVRLI